MQNQTVARRYATAIFSLAKERGVVATVGKDLHAALGAIEGDDDARRFFLSPVVDRGEKQKIFASSFASLDEVALHSVLLLVRKRREALLPEIVKQFDALALADAGFEQLAIASARPLAPAEVDDIVTRLSRLYGRRFDVRQSVDPALLGGVRITLGDRVIDGTIAGRLDNLFRDLLAAPAAAGATPGTK
jgi:F-type H+-transporting ATPase subunit delta